MELFLVAVMGETSVLLTAVERGGAPQLRGRLPSGYGYGKVIEGAEMVEELEEPPIGEPRVLFDPGAVPVDHGVGSSTVVVVLLAYGATAVLVEEASIGDTSVDPPVLSGAVTVRDQEGRVEVVLGYNVTVL